MNFSVDAHQNGANIPMLGKVGAENKRQHQLSKTKLFG